MIRASVIHSAVLNACSTNALKIKIYYTIPVQRICFFQNIFMHLYGNLYSTARTCITTSYDFVMRNPIEGYIEYMLHGLLGAVGSAVLHDHVIATTCYYYADAPAPLAEKFNFQRWLGGSYV